MQTFDFTIKNSLGLHARPASKFARTAGQYKSEIIVDKDGKIINAKSILEVLSSGLICGKSFRVTITGEDEIAAAQELKTFLDELED